MTGPDRSAELLSAGAAHDIANALSAVLGWVQLAHDGADTEQALDAIEAAARAARDTALLLLGDSEDRGPADLAATARTVGRLLAPEARRRGVRIELRAEQPTPTPLGPAAAFRCVWNLALNAVQHARQEVQIRVSPEPGLWVCDDGPGMDADAQRRLMTSGLTTRPDGHGLGVRIVRRLAEEVGGGLTVESAPGRGATFRLRLPRVHVPRSKPVSGVQPRIARRVLVVEDDQGVREMVTTALELRGVEVIATRSLAEVEALAGPPFDLALVDFTLADASGLDVIRLLRSRALAKRIVLATGASEPYLPPDAQPDRWLRKPYDVGQLFETLAFCPSGRGAVG